MIDRSHSAQSRGSHEQIAGGQEARVETREQTRFGARQERAAEQFLDRISCAPRTAIRGEALAISGLASFHARSGSPTTPRRFHAHHATSLTTDHTTLDRRIRVSSASFLLSRPILLPVQQPGAAGARLRRLVTLSQPHVRPRHQPLLAPRPSLPLFTCAVFTFNCDRAARARS